MGWFEEQRQIEDSARSDRGAWLAVGLAVIALLAALAAIAPPM